MLYFDEPALRAELAALSPVHRTVFALLCATRLAPAFEHASVSRDTFQAEHRLLWRHLIEAPLADFELAALHARLDALLPDEEGAAPHAEDAVAALLFAVRCARDGDTADAVWAAERAYNSLDTYVQVRTGVDPAAPGGEEAILQHPLIQEEFTQQRRDLRALRAPATDRAAHFTELRAMSETATLFGVAG